MKKFIIIVTAIVLLLAAALAGAVFAYSKTAEYENGVFPYNTYINGVDCSGLTYGQAAETITDSWNSRHIIITGSLNEELASFTDFGYTYELEEQLEKARYKNLLLSSLNHFLNTPLNLDIPMVVSDYVEDFKETVLSSEFLNLDTATESKSAYVDMSNPNFPIIPEVYGTKPDTEKLFDDLTHAIQLGKMSMSFDEKQYYSLPEVTAEDKALNEYQRYCKAFLSQKITYELGEETFTLTAEELNSLMKDDMSGEPDEKAIAKFVDELAEEYDNIGADRKFQSYSGREVEVSGGLYGWQIDKAEERDRLTADISSHEDVSREPVYSVSGYGEYSRDLGKTYIDVDISYQVVEMYIDGETVFRTPCVTGCRATGTLTDTGTYYILNQVRNVVLRGDNADGTEYESPVKYWLGINYAGEGFHDANWRSSFGGSIWIRNGSHGCINIPPSRMPELYSLAEIGMPVVVHY